jgi:hypothetical protein
MTAYSFIVTEYQNDKPWLVEATHRDSVELPEGEHFQEWVTEHWPRERYSVRLDPQTAQRWI